MTPVRSLLGVLFRLAIVCLCALSTASAQPYVTDGTVVTNQDPVTGEIDLDLGVTYGGVSPQSQQYADYGSYQIPGFEPSGYNDCNCNPVAAGSTQYGYWDIYKDGPWGSLGSDWYANLYWTFYEPVPSNTPCPVGEDGCLSAICHNQLQSQTIYIVEYTQVYGYLSFSVY